RVSTFDERIRNLPAENLVVGQSEMLRLLRQDLALYVLDGDRQIELLEHRVAVRETVRQAADFDQGRALNLLGGFAALDVDPWHPLGLEIAVLEQDARNHDTPEIMAPDRTGHGAAFGGRTPGRLLHVTVLTNRSLQNFPRQILLRDVFDLVEMAGRTVIGAPEQRHLHRFMHEVLFRIAIGAVHDLSRLDLERRRRSVRALFDQMTGSTADAFNLRLA